MSILPTRFRKLVEALRALPGVGDKAALRLANLLVLEQPDLGRHLREALEECVPLKPCRWCGFLTEEEECAICRDTERERQLCLVAQAADVFLLERTGKYRGRYFVVGMLISPLEGIEERDLPTDRLGRMLQRFPMREVILAFPPTLEGELTAQYLGALLRKKGYQVSELARGIPVGITLEYADEVTLGRALETRRRWE